YKKVLKKLFNQIEEQLKTDAEVDAVAVKVKLQSIDRKGNLFIVARVKKKNGAYYRTHPIHIDRIINVGLIPAAIYIKVCLYKVTDDWELSRMRRFFKKLEKTPLD